MMSGHATIETAVEATRIGALDFLEKPIACSACSPRSSGAAQPGGDTAPQAHPRCHPAAPVPWRMPRSAWRSGAVAAPLMLRGERGMRADCSPGCWWLRRAVPRRHRDLAEPPSELLAKARAACSSCRT